MLAKNTISTVEGAKRLYVTYWDPQPPPLAPFHLSFQSSWGSDLKNKSVVPVRKHGRVFAAEMRQKKRVSETQTDARAPPSLNRPMRPIPSIGKKDEDMEGVK